MSSETTTPTAIAVNAEARTKTPNERCQPPPGRRKKKFLSDGAERMRLHRARRRRGLRCVMIEIRLVEIKELARRGYLSLDSRDNPESVIAALHRFLDESLNSTKRPVTPHAG